MIIRVHKPPTSQQKELEQMINLRPSEFTEFAVYLPVDGEPLPFSFNSREYLLPIYNTKHRRVLLCCGRQVEKSTMIGNKIIAGSILRRFYKSLFVSPTQQQTETFSRDRLETPIAISPKLRPFMSGRRRKENVLYKRFATESDITLRYAFLHADRCRGLSQIDTLCIDEIQDVLADIIPVIEETQSHSKHKYKLYAGTPKSFDNTLAYYWENFSTQNEWVIPCDRCGGGDYRYWNIIGENNIGPECLVCDRCFKPINAAHVDAQWSSFNPNPAGIQEPFDGYRVAQPMTPWVEWADILDKKVKYTRQRFFNEVLGLGYDLGDRPLTKKAIRECCNPNLSIQTLPDKLPNVPHFIGLDYANGERAYTVITVGRYRGPIFEYVYAKRLEGEDSTPVKTMEIIKFLIRKYDATMIGADYGGGFEKNDELVRTFGAGKLAKFQYANTKKKLYYENDLHRFMANRTAVLMDFINAINRGGVFSFPRWEEWEHPFADDMTNIFIEFNEKRGITVLNKVPTVPDDTLHSALYCFLASLIIRPRPDIIQPDKEIK